MPAVSRRPSRASGRPEFVEGRGCSAPLVATAYSDVSYRFSFSFTVTRTNATVDPSGEICGSAIQVNLKRSFSVMKRAPCARGDAVMTTRTQARAAYFFICALLSINMSVRDVIIVGAGPSGLSAAIACKQRDLDYQVLEPGVLVNSIFRFPPQLVFFTTPELLEIGGVPLTSPYDKPTRGEALTYYRKVTDKFDLQLSYEEKVLSIEREDSQFAVETRSSRGVRRVRLARHVILAIGYY